MFIFTKFYKKSFLHGKMHIPSGYAEIIRVGLPLVISMGSNSIMQFTDRMFLSHYSQEAIAAAMPASLVSFTCILTVIGICSYSAVLIAQYVGSRAPHRVGTALWQSIWLALVFGVLMVFLSFAGEWLFSLAGHEPLVQKYEVDYFRVLTVGSVFPLMAAVLASFFYGRGQNRIVMWANIAAMLLNIPLDFILIFGAFGVPSLGVFGAGLATVTGSVLTCLILGFSLFTKEHEREYKVRSAWRLEWDMMLRLIRFGFPSGVNMFIEVIAFTWLAFEIGVLGTTALAASNIAFSINDLVFIPMLGLNVAIAMLVGQNMGAGNPKAAERYTYQGIHLSFLYIVPLCLLFVFKPEFLVGLYISADADPIAVGSLLRTGRMLLYFVAAYTLVDTCGIIFLGALRGAGDTAGVLKLLSFSLFFCLIAPLTVIKYVWGPNLIAYWAVATWYMTFLSVGAWYRFWRKKWYTIQVVETAQKSSVNEV